MKNANPQENVKFYLPVFHWFKTKEHCSVCGHFIGGKYGLTTDRKKICYRCCGEHDRKMLASANPGDKFVFYFSGGEVSNWPGSFKIKVYAKKSNHNFGCERYDFHFSVGNNRFHGFQIGSSNEIAYIRCLKK